MTLRLLPPAAAALACAFAASLAAAQSPTLPTAGPAAAAVSPGSAPAARGAPSPEAQAAEDRVVALVQQKRCGAAHDEAVRSGLTSLAEQIAAACGTRNSAPSPGGKSGGGSGRGRRPPS